MGTTQLLLIVLAVVIVITAVAVGIGMYNNHISKQNRLAIINDLQVCASRALGFYKTPQTQGGGGGLWLPTEGAGDSSLGEWLGYDDYEAHDNPGDRFITENGIFTLDIGWEDYNPWWQTPILYIIGNGNETGFDPDYENNNNQNWG
jgi:hypothetical protein